jgi:hypothetical protein
MQYWGLESKNASKDESGLYAANSRKKKENFLGKMVWNQASGGVVSSTGRINMPDQRHF